MPVKFLSFFLGVALEISLHEYNNFCEEVLAGDPNFYFLREWTMHQTFCLAHYQAFKSQLSI